MASATYLGNPNLKNVGQTIQWTEETLEEYKNCMESPQHFIENYVQIVHVDKGLVPFTMYPYQEKMFKHFNKVCFVRVLNTKNLELDTIKNISNNGLSIVGHKPYINGRFELLWYLQEQSISENFHRYGNLIFREKKIKA